MLGRWDLDTIERVPGRSSAVTCLVCAVLSYRCAILAYVPRQAVCPVSRQAVCPVSHVEAASPPYCSTAAVLTERGRPTPRGTDAWPTPGSTEPWPTSGGTDACPTLGGDAAGDRVDLAAARVARGQRLQACRDGPLPASVYGCPAALNGGSGDAVYGGSEMLFMEGEVMSFAETV